MEAKALVAEFLKRLQSIGVVTFNSEQQTLIEDLLDRERLRRPKIEPAFSPEETTEKEPGNRAGG